MQRPVSRLFIYQGGLLQNRLFSNGALLSAQLCIDFSGNRYNVTVSAMIDYRALLCDCSKFFGQTINDINLDFICGQRIVV